jgi:hypothetical protein
MQASQHRTNELQISMPSTAATTNPLAQSECRTPLRFRPAGDFATEREHRFGRLSFERIADGVVADRSDAFGQHSLATLGFDLKQAGNLHGGTQENGVKHLLPGVLWKLPALGQSGH